MSIQETICPGCGLQMPVDKTATYDGYYHTTPECWSVYTEVLGAEFDNAIVYGQVHQLTVDSYAIQHAGGPHPDKSVAVHLAGLHLVLERGIKPPVVPKYLKQLADVAEPWPHFPPPEDNGSLTVCDVALADTPEAHIEAVRAWANAMWATWSPYHNDVTEFVASYLTIESPRTEKA